MYQSVLGRYNYLCDLYRTSSALYRQVHAIIKVIILLKRSQQDIIKINSNFMHTTITLYAQTILFIHTYYTLYNYGLMLT